jgi:hypothetical protein
METYFSLDGSKGNDLCRKIVTAGFGQLNTNSWI